MEAKRDKEQKKRDAEQLAKDKKAAEELAKLATAAPVPPIVVHAFPAWPPSIGPDG